MKMEKQVAPFRKFCFCSINEYIEIKSFKWIHSDLLFAVVLLSCESFTNMFICLTFFTLKYFLRLSLSALLFFKIQTPSIIWPIVFARMKAQKIFFGVSCSFKLWIWFWEITMWTKNIIKLMSSLEIIPFNSTAKSLLIT